MSIRNPDADRLATGETKPEAVTPARQDRPVRLRRESTGRTLADELDANELHCSRLPVLDERAPG